MDNKMKNVLWGSIDDFRSLNEFERFSRWMDGKIATGEAAEVKVARPYLDAPSFKEKWYCHVASKEVWRLVWPDDPFTGLFERVV